MGTISLAVAYAVRFSRRDGVLDAGTMQAALDGDRGTATHSGQRYELDGTATQDRDHVYVCMELSIALEEPHADRCAGQLKELSGVLEAVINHLAYERGGGTLDRRREHDPGAILWGRVKTAVAQATARVPLLSEDHGVLTTDAAAKHAVTASVRETVDFWTDQQKILAALQVQLDHHGLVITAASPHAAVELAKAYLSATRRRAKPKESLPRRPVWAAASAAIALLSFGMSWAPLTWPILSVFSFLSIVIAVAAIAVAPRLFAPRSATAWGMAPILSLCAFAFAYGATALAEPGAIELNQARLRFLREPLLLSLSLLTTVGVLDFRLDSWVRSLAYLEILLVASLAGGAVVVVVRWFSERADRIVAEVRRDRLE